jgi:diguanylate cyclase
VYSDDDIEYSSKLHQKAIVVLGSQQLPLTPVNYAVLYAHVSLRQPELTQAFKSQLNTGKPIDNPFLRGLFDTYLVNQQRFQEEMIQPFDGMIDNMLLQIDSQVKSEQAMVATLSSMGNRLTTMNNQLEVQEVVADLGGITSKAKQGHQDLFEELSHAHEKINQLKARLKESEKEAITDPLTGLLNRRGMQQKLELIDSPEKTACIIIDIDHFKSINDTFGHLVGDKIIKRVTGEIKQHIRGRDLAIRWGGEEFAILLIDTPVEGAKRVAETLRKKIDSLKLIIKANNIRLPPISISLGIASFDSQLEWEHLFKRADDALYAAKQGGRNQTRVFSEQEFEKVVNAAF